MAKMAETFEDWDHNQEKKSNTNTPFPLQSHMMPCLKMRLSSGRIGKITIIALIKCLMKREGQKKKERKKNLFLKESPAFKGKHIERLLLNLRDVCFRDSTNYFLEKQTNSKHVLFHSPFSSDV